MGETSTAREYVDEAPGEPDFSSLGRSVRRLHAWEPLRIEGALPAEISATVIRTGAGLLDRFGVRVEHAFMSDGVMVGLRMTDGRAEGAVRAVETPQYLAEEADGRFHFGASAPRWRRVLNAVRNEYKATGNTAFVRWNDRTFALMEAGLPVEVDPRDLSTLGTRDLGGVIKGAFSAHAHRLDAAGITYNFGAVYGPKPRARLYALPDDGPARIVGEVAMPYNAMIHDFAVTERFAVFVVCPLKMRLGRALLRIGGLSEMFHFDDTSASEVIIAQWDRLDAPIRVPIEPRFIFHLANAFERDGELVVDFVQYPDGEILLALSANDKKARAGGSKLQRVRVDLRRRRLVAEETIWNNVCEFPTLVPQAVGRDYDRVWLMWAKKGASGRGLVRVDPSSGALDAWVPSDGVRATEPMFLPRPGSEGQGQGWIVSLCLDGYRRESFFAVLDAQNIAAGPVAKVWMDQPLHYTYHGVVIPDSPRTP